MRLLRVARDVAAQYRFAVPEPGNIYVTLHLRNVASPSSLPPNPAGL